MKKQILLPAIAVLFAVGGAFASNRFTPGYYENSDVTCSEPIAKPCDKGDGIPCLDQNSDQYRYRADFTDTSTEGCVLLERNP